MGTPSAKSNQRPRELRRRVIIPARLRTGASWGDACILNISSRGLMIQSGRTGPEGSVVELRRGDHVIIAEVVWRDGARAGLRSEERVPVEEIMSIGQSGPLQLVASDGARIERRKQPRVSGDAQVRGRLIDVAGTGAIALGLAACVGGLVTQALASPFAQIEAALAGHPATSGNRGS